jgi:hypothetical protein
MATISYTGSGSLAQKNWEASRSWSWSDSTWRCDSDGPGFSRVHNSSHGRGCHHNPPNQRWLYSECALRFWHDRWLNGQAPKDIAPTLYKLAWRKNISVAVALSDMRWMRGMRRVSSAKEVRQFIQLWEASGRSSSQHNRTQFPSGSQRMGSTPL